MGAAIPLRFEPAVPLDRRGRALRDLRISVLDRCNFRCPYCMPEERYPRDHEFLSKAERLRFEEIERLASVFAGLGVHKLRLTGGEPLLRRDLPELVRRLARIPGIDDMSWEACGSVPGDGLPAAPDAGAGVQPGITIPAMHVGPAGALGRAASPAARVGGFSGG